MLETTGMTNYSMIYLGSHDAEWGLELEEDYQLQWQVDSVYGCHIFIFKSTLWNVGWRDIHILGSVIYSKY